MDFAESRRRMVDEQLRSRGVEDPVVLGAFLKTPREWFVPPEYRDQAYEDHPIPIGYDQTISQPFIVGLMISHLHLRPDEKVLEIGTGSGFQTAILSQLAGRVFSMERIPELSAAAGLRLRQLGFEKAQLGVSDGSQGWPEHAPYDAIIVSASSPELPQPLFEQLKPSGRIILPIGNLQEQALTLVSKTQQGPQERVLGECVFVPLIGRYGWSLPP